jgi:hypothetical protein
MCARCKIHAFNLMDLRCGSEQFHFRLLSSCLTIPLHKSIDSFTAIALTVDPQDSVCGKTSIENIAGGFCVISGQRFQTVQRSITS